MRGHVGRQKSRDEREDDAEEAHEQRASALPENAAQAGFKSGSEKKKHDSEHADRLEHNRNRAAGREQRRIPMRPEVTEYRGPEHNTGSNFSQDGRLSNFLHELGPTVLGHLRPHWYAAL